MSIIKESDLKAQIKSQNFEKFYLLFGEENYLTEYYTKTLVQNILGNNINSFNYKVFYKNKLNLDELENFSEAISFTNTNKCILIKDLELNTLSTTNIKKLKEIIKNLPEKITLIISQINIENNKKHSNSFNSFIKFSEKEGQVVEFKKLSKIALEKQLISWAKKLSKNLSSNNAGLIIENCGENLGVLKNEIEKLCAYSQGIIAEDDINNIVIKKLEANVFELTKLISSKNFGVAIKKLNLLFKMKESPIAILSIISNYYIDIYRVKIFKNSGETIYKIKEIFKEYKNKDFILTNAQKVCEKLSLESIKNILYLLVKTDLKLKSSNIDQKTVLEELIIKISKIY